ncbi:hypothetical protein INT43_004277 [Umbelopsis isabellina]|uniref:Uncharacterized protein n=1 Tax=Mortierella isabellina TaxID=91625 RepID=A0A8H7PJ63_MORIS|nr:hypothetical protein INT43_004277 [Umbelopsis isabellina]
MAESHSTYIYGSRICLETCNICVWYYELHSGSSMAGKAKSDKTDKVTPIELDLDVSDSDTAQARTSRKSTSISTKPSTPLSQPRQRQPPAAAKPASKKTSSPSKVLPTQQTASGAGAEEPNITNNDNKPFCKSTEPDSSNTENKPTKNPDHPIDDHFISKQSVENLQTKDTSAFSAKKTNAVPEVKQVDLAEADDDFITAEKRKRRRTRGGAKAQRQKQAQTEPSNVSTNHVPKIQVKKHHDETTAHKVSEKESVSTQRPPPPQPTSGPNHMLEPRRKEQQPTQNYRSSVHEETVHDEGRITPKSSPRSSNSNVTYANITAKASNNNSPVADESSPPIASAPQQPVSPSPSHSSTIISDNDKRQSWYSPFSSGLELDIVPRPQPSTSSESIPFNRRSPTLAMDTSAMNYQHPEVLDALFRGSRQSHLDGNTGLGLTYAIKGEKGVGASGVQPSPVRWDMFGNGRAPIAPPAGSPGFMANHLKADTDWIKVPDINDLPNARNPRQSWGVIGSHERETWQEQPNVDQAERKNSKVGFSFFDRRLSSFSPRR